MIQQMLEVSTENISEDAVQWISRQAKLTEENEMDLIVYPKGDYGYFIPLYPDMLKYQTVKESVAFLIGYAIGKGCSWIMIDRDAAPIEDLPTYDW